MTPVFDNAVPIIISIVVAVAGSGGIVFGALRYNRDEAGRVVSQQTEVLASMRALNDELSGALDRMRVERDNLTTEFTSARSAMRSLNGELTSALDRMRIERDALSVEVKALTVEIQTLHGVVDQLKGDL